MAGHRITLKSKNKSFKSGHASKRSIKAATKGKVEKVTASNRSIKAQSKLERKNTAKQLKNIKLQKTLNERMLFNNNVTERIVTILPLASNISKLDIVNKLLGSVEEEDLEIQEDVSVTSIKVRRFKANLKFILPDMTNFISILDASKVADFVVFGLSATEEVSPKVGEQIIRAVEAQGIATAFGVIPNLISSYPKKNLQLDVLKSLTSFYEHFFPNNDRLYALESPTESLNLLRTICQKFPKSITWRDSRGYLIADKIEWQPYENPIEGNLVIEGVSRGIGFHPNRLIHLPGFGDYQITKVEKIKTSLKKSDQEMFDENDDVFTPTEQQETLDELMPIEEKGESDDGMEDEDWNVDDMQNQLQGNFDGFGTEGRRKRLPKGISEYQAKWLLDDEIDELIGENGEASDDEFPEEQIDSGDDIMDEENDTETFGTKSVYAQSEVHVELSEEEEARQLKMFQQREREELEFPDEIELHPQESAKKRLARYRGLKSLAGCDWDYDEYDEKKPGNWSRYLKVRNFKATKNKVTKEAKNEAVIRPGEKCRIYLHVPSYVLEKIVSPQEKPFVLYSLLAHEHKLSICNFTIQTWEDYDKPIKSKDTMIVQYGFRRVMINPLFSQASRNSNNVTKFERFLHQGNISVATAAIPISFSHASALFFKNGADGSIEIMAQGTFMNTDVTRIIAKRSVLTGEIFKIHKSVVTVRYMFFNSDDVEEYISIPIFTKMGRSGLIKEKIGTHGYFKAKFDGTLNPQDIVAMPFYKRVWPREGNSQGL